MVSCIFPGWRGVSASAIEGCAEFGISNRCLALSVLKGPMYMYMYMLILMYMYLYMYMYMCMYACMLRA